MAIIQVVRLSVITKLKRVIAISNRIVLVMPRMSFVASAVGDIVV
jgi:hypothetical protein